MQLGFIRFCLSLGFLGGLVFLAYPQEEEFTPLFNGKDLSGFKVVLDPRAKEIDSKETWTIKEGTLILLGKPFGYLHTEKSFKKYVLQFDWRYPNNSPEKSNSGCLVHIQSPHQIWPRSVEIQLRYQDHGKLFFPRVDPKKEVTEEKFDLDASKKARKPINEWNTTEITCKADGTIQVKLNGTEVSSGKTALTEGPIGWMAEGYEVHFKNIRIKEMK
jgi:hypothetical protein